MRGKAGAGATPPSGLPQRLTPRWSLPPPLIIHPENIDYRSSNDRSRIGPA
jgi:hypothetical protein